MICDVSKWQGMIDWDALAPALEDGYVAIKASGLFANGADPYYARNVAGAVAHSIPIHAFHFLYCLTETEARRDAGLFYRTVEAAGHWPLFWVLDCEGGWGIEYSRARPMAEAFEAELRRMARENGPGEIRVAVYIGHNVYDDYALDYGRYAYVWIPRYGANDGTIQGSKRPDHHCDVWQYTSDGHLPGIAGRVDLDVLMGTKPLSYFTGADEDEKKGADDMLTSAQLVQFCEDVYKACWVYWYGTYGKQCSEKLYESKKKQYPAHYGSDRTAGYMKDIREGKWCADCVGMIKGFFWKNGDLTAQPVYKSNNCPDKSANGMIAYCSETGPIKTMPDEPGLVVWKDGHIGVYVGGGYTVEMKGFNYDCRRNKLSSGPWTKWGRLPASMIRYTDAPEPAPAPKLGDRELKKGCKGEDVAELQRDLMQLGYALPKYGADGDFGSETEKAVKAFQTDHHLTADGVMHSDDYTMLFAALDGQDVQPGPEPPTPAPIAQEVEITGGSVNVRAAPGTTGTRVLGTVHKGDRLPYQGQTAEVDGRDWYLVEYKNQNGWVSSKYARLV